MTATASLHRPRSVAEMLQRAARMISAEGMQRALAFEPRPDDVFVAPFPKSGTTWLQQIVHTLRTGGDMAFEEITEVIPWLELAHDMGIDVQGDQRAAPRAFKTHLGWDQVPKGARYILSVRDPRDVLVSQFHFWNGWFYEAGSVSIDDIAMGLFLNPNLPFSYWRHLQSWWPQRTRPDVLMLCYESMLADPAAAIRRIAAFIGVPLDDVLLRLTLEHSSVDFMRAHARQFDDHLVREARDEACGLPPSDAGGHKVRSGKAGGHAAVLNDVVRAALDEAWRREIAGPLGLPDYVALRRALAGAGE
jgi:hypothetical protein